MSGRVAVIYGDGEVVRLEGEEITLWYRVADLFPDPDPLECAKLVKAEQLAE